MTGHSVDALLDKACELEPDAQKRTELRAEVKRMRESCTLDEIGERVARRYLVGLLRHRGVDVSAYRSVP